MKNNNKKCFIDFDGTIVSNKKRLYQFFIDNLEEAHKNYVDIEEYWNLKRMAVNEVEWINNTFHTKYSVQELGDKKAREIENEYYLRFE